MPGTLGLVYDLASRLSDSLRRLKARPLRRTGLFFNAVYLVIVFGGRSELFDQVSNLVLIRRVRNKFEKSLEFVDGILISVEAVIKQ